MRYACPRRPERLTTSGLSSPTCRSHPGPTDAVVEVHASAVNPSDVKAALGAMPQALWPRTPGRDYAGIVVHGPAEWTGRAVWGSSGECGITRDGAHATHLVLPVTCLRTKPDRLSFAEAASVGVPFVTAAQGFSEAGGIKADDVVLVLGSNGTGGAGRRAARRARRRPCVRGGAGRAS